MQILTLNKVSDSANALIEKKNHFITFTGVKVRKLSFLQVSDFIKKGCIHVHGMEKNHFAAGEQIRE